MSLFSSMASCITQYFESIEQVTAKNSCFGARYSASAGKTCPEFMAVEQGCTLSFGPAPAHNPAITTAAILREYSQKMVA